MDDDTFTICSAKFLLSPYRFRIRTHLENRRLNEWMNERETRDGAGEREEQVGCDIAWRTYQRKLNNKRCHRIVIYITRTKVMHRSPYSYTLHTCECEYRLATSYYHTHARTLIIIYPTSHIQPTGTLSSVLIQPSCTFFSPFSH